MSILSFLKATGSPASEASALTAGLVNSPSGNTALANCSWLNPKRKYD